MKIEDHGERTVRVFYAGSFKLHFDSEEGSVSCECTDHTRYILDPLQEQRCEHSGLVWRQLHEGGLLG